MGQIIEEIINDFTGGISDDPRRKDVGLSQMVTNFDIFSNKKRLIPTMDTENGDSASSTSQKQNFDVGYWTPGTDWRVFALGVISGTGKAEVTMKTLSTGGSTDLSDASWASPANNQSAAGSTDFNLFRYYKTTGKFYGAKSGTTIWAFTPDGATAFDDANHALAYTNIAQGIVHTKDDCLYIPYDNKIARNNNGSWTDAALTIPSHLKITSICEFGNYLAIGAAPLSGVGKSRVFLWDRDASLATLAESIDWGEGTLKVLEELEGGLIGISLDGGNLSHIKSRVVFRKYEGSNTAKPFAQFILAAGASVNVLQAKQKANERVYFMMNIVLSGVTREGVWAIGVSSSGSYAIALERVPDNGTAVTSANGVLKNFIVVGDYFFISYVDSGSAYALRKTNDQGVYTTTASYETVIKDANDGDLTKKLIAAAAAYEPLSSGGKGRLYYQKDEETSWRKIFEHSTQNSLGKGAVNIVNDTNSFTVTIASPGVFTQEYHGLAVGQRIRFKTTGALPTGLATGTDYYVLSTGLTESTFRVSTTNGGAAVNTSGSQSGTHTIDRLSENLKQGKEFRLRADSVGGAVITALKYKMEVLDKNPY